MNRHISITDCLKATAATEGDRRFVYVEASNESKDFQNEVILAKALKESAPYYLRYGNLDLDHVTQIGRKSGVADYHFYEIGRPVDVRVGENTTFVKGEIYAGDGPSSERANLFWDSITRTDPPQRWYPSVGGQVLDAEPRIDDDGKTRVITKVRWSNIGFSKTPVNLKVPEVSAMPIGVFAKAFDGYGLDLKALEAGYGTDSAALTGGGALRRQSLEGRPLNYLQFRERVSSDMRGKKIKDPSAKSLAEHCMGALGLSKAQTDEWLGRFMHDLSINLKRSKP